MRTYAPRDAEERIFGVAAGLIADGTLTMDDVGAFLLGVDIAARVDRKLLEPLFGVIRQAAEAYGPIATAFVGRTWDDEEDALQRVAVSRRFAALGLGLASGTGTR